MKNILKAILGFLGFLAVLFVLLVLFRNAVVKAVVEQAVTRMTGFETKVKDIRIDFPAVVLVKGLEIKNPPGFEQRTLANIPEIYIDFNLREFLRKERIHLREVRLNLQEVGIEKNAKGVSNIELLSKAAQPKSGAAVQQAKPAGQKGAAMPFLCDRMVLTLRNVRYSDKSQGAVTGTLGKVVPLEQAPNLKSLSIDLNVQDQVFTDIKDPLAIVNIVLLKIVYGTTFGKLAGLDPDKLLKGSLKETFQSGEAIFKQTGGAVAARAAEATGLLEAPAIEAKTSLEAAQKKLTGALGQGTSGLFGKMKSALPGTETVETQSAEPAASTQSTQ